MTARLKLSLVALALGLLLAGVLAGQVNSQESGPPIATLRGMTSLDQEATPPRIPQTEETDRRRERNYPEQPPTIPHQIAGYQLDADVNQCLSCHARSRVSESGAPMISITHFMDRDGQFLATVSARRYFCDQCHVTQDRVTPLVGNSFVDIDSLLAVEESQSK